MENNKNEKFLWYIVHCNTGQESTVADLIKTRANNYGLKDYIEEIYVPIQEKITLKKGKKQTINEKIFKGYIFIKMILNDKTWPLVRDTQGVINFTGTAKKPTPIKEEEVEAIKKYCSRQESSYKVKILEGDRVKITVGEFKDFTGTVTHIDYDKGKVVVMVQFLNRDVPVELDIANITNL